MKAVRKIRKAKNVAEVDAEKAEVANAINTAKKRAETVPKAAEAKKAAKSLLRSDLLYSLVTRTYTDGYKHKEGGPWYKLTANGPVKLGNNLLPAGIRDVKGGIRNLMMPPGYWIKLINR